MAEDITFEPMGGYPPIIKKSDLRRSKTTLGSRGFSSANILKIQDILKKGKNIPIIDTTSIGGDNLIDNDPKNYQKLSYKKIK